MLKLALYWRGFSHIGLDHLLNFPLKQQDPEDHVGDVIGDLNRRRGMIKDNIPKKHDLVWFKKGGGMLGKQHVDAGFANGGEKAWYWLLATVI